jgi:acyl carrier protein
LSSVDVMTLIVQVEEVFGIYFDDGEIADSVQTFGSLVRAIHRKQAEGTLADGPDDV